MSNLPVLHSDTEFPARHLASAAKAQRNTELAVFKHSLKTRYEAECVRLATQALLRNVYYLGQVSDDGKVYEGHHEPLVDEANSRTSSARVCERR